MASLGVAPTSPAGVAMADAIRENDPGLAPPLDQVFGMLQREYSRSTIEKEVRGLLRTPRNADTRNHESILKLSVDADGKPFVVTTNFDLMFEKVEGRLQRWCSPLLPSMVFNESPRGIVYLHGRLAHNHDESGNLILSSADFGRAYLADGWSTEFMRDLLERRVVVLLGYSASDPPIRYLLEGLSTSSSSKLRTIYAFDKGPAEDVRAKWNELGIVGIGFDQFSHLWATLDAWANRSSNKSAWVSQVIRLAHSSPRNLAAYQRGQVVALVATPDGAKSFAEATPAPPSEWLRVFDKYSRYGRVEKARPPQRPNDIDPHHQYGLDDDPPRDVSGEARAVQEGVDILSTLPTDVAETGRSRISNMYHRALPLNSRLQWFVQWFARVLDQPAALWWAMRQRGLHPEMLAAIRRRLTHIAPTMPPLDGEARRVWSLLLEALVSSANHSSNHEWVNLQIRIRADGWTGAVLRELQDIAQPYLVAHPFLFDLSLHPANGEPVEIGRVVRFDVQTPSRRGANIDVPDDYVRPVVRIMRGVLERAIGLLDDAHGSHKFYRTPAISPEIRGNWQPPHQDGLDADFLWFVELCERLRKLSPDSLREEVNAWPAADGYFFARLRMHFWKERDLFDGQAVGHSILAFSDDIFWSPYAKRELLPLLRARWGDFSSTHRHSIERRILKGRRQYDGESPKDHSADKKYNAGIALGWLQRNRCRLSPGAEKALTRIRSAKDWPTEHELGADHDSDGRTGWVEQRKDPSDLRNLPNGLIASRALEMSKLRFEDFVEDRPFTGLVESQPVKALLALTIERRRGNYPVFLWRQLISSWPTATSERLFLACAHRLADLPTEAMFELRYEVTRWIERFALRMYQLQPEEFGTVWDKVFHSLCQSGEKATASAISRSTDSKGNARSTKTVDHAINGPIGHLLEALFNTFGDKKFVKGESFPEGFRVRVERALGAPGDGASHTAILLGRQLNFLYLVDSRWFKREILPHLSVDDALSESLWAGAIAEIKVPAPAAFFKAVKQDFLMILGQPEKFHLDEGADRKLAQMLIQATFWSVKHAGYVTVKECRDALRTCSESGRQAALWVVEQIVPVENNWELFGKGFFKLAWPREVAYRTSSTSEAMARLATEMRDKFPEVVDAIQEYLTFVEYPDTVIFGLLDERHGTSIAARWPTETLAVLTKTIRLDTSSVPFQLGTVLNLIADANESLRTHKAWRDLAGLLSR